MVVIYNATENVNRQLITHEVAHSLYHELA